MNSDPADPPDAGGLRIYNYAAAFVDLLGQKEAMAGCSLVPSQRDGTEYEGFLTTVKSSVAAIRRLHKTAQQYFDAYTTHRSPAVEQLPPEVRAEFEEARKANLRFQRFSDGLVAYMSLGDPELVSPLTGIFGLIGACGALCFTGLALGEPVRIGLEIAWGAELEENELCGCVIAKAHDLESRVARYPRAVVGDEFKRFLETHSTYEGPNRLMTLNAQGARSCLAMLAIDFDGHYIVDYLGLAYRNTVAGEIDQRLFELAKKFVDGQLKNWRSSKNSELAFRYTILASYFEHNKGHWTGGHRANDED